MNEQGYLLDNRAADAKLRFDALSAVFDRWTFDHLQALGIERGWRCWEVGAGGPSVPSWLADHVGSEGAVVATDIDTSWLGASGAYRILQHDVTSDEPPGEGYDLVHARLVLSHLPERDEALRLMTGALRRGGWLLVEDFDVGLQPLACPAPTQPAEERANRVREGFLALLAQRGVDLSLGRSLPRRLRSLGLSDIQADAYIPLALPATRDLERANVQQVRAGLVAYGIGDADIDGHLAALEQADFDIATPPLVSARARSAGVNDL
jgi:hypothetical protein